MTPDELSRMDNKNCLVFIRGLSPFFTKKYDYPRHKNYKFTEDADSNNAFICSEKFDLSKEYDKVETEPELFSTEIKINNYILPDDDLPFVPETLQGVESFVEKDMEELIDGIEDPNEISDTYELEEVYDPENEFGI